MSATRATQAVARDTWRTFAGVVLVLGIALAACVPTVRSLLGFWNDYDNLTYTHGYLVAAICVWLLWRARADLAAIPARLTWSGVAVLVLATVAWGYALAAGIEAVHQVLLPVVLLAAVAAFGGWRMATVLLLPVGYLYFAIPLWDHMIGILQQLTIEAVTLVLRAFAVPAWVEGSFVHLGPGTFEIAGGCSGLHFFIVALAIAVLYGELGRDPLKVRMQLVAIAAVMAILMNWVRVATIIISGYLTDMQGFLVKVDHYYFGWALFGVLLAVFIWGVPRWLHLAPPSKPDARAAAAVPARSPASTAAALAVAAIAVALPSVATAALMRGARNNPLPSVSAPELSAWTGPLPADESWRPDFPHADQQWRAGYLRDGGRVELFAAHYAYQEQGKELVGYGHDLIPDGWKRVRARTLAADPARGVPELALTIADTGEGGRWAIASRYVIGGRTFTSGFRSKLYYPVALASGRPHSAIVAAAAPCAAEGCKAAVSVIEEFMASGAAALLQDREVTQ